MATPIGDKADQLVQLMMGALRHVAWRDHIPERIVKAMQFRVDSQYDAARDGFLLRVAWRDPETNSCVRSMSMQVDRFDLEDRDHLHRRILVTIDDINLRGELFFFKLHKHFPNWIAKVRCDRDGRVHVKFKNGRELSVDEQELDSLEFLATCGMVYDL
jgi:hypothetical protein